jgi:hypothetical protein
MKWLECEVDHLLPPSAGIESLLNYITTFSTRLHGIVLNWPQVTFFLLSYKSDGLHNEFIVFMVLILIQ